MALYGHVTQFCTQTFFLTNEIKERANVLSLYFEKINLMAITIGNHLISVSVGCNVRVC